MDKKNNTNDSLKEAFEEFEKAKANEPKSEFKSLLGESKAFDFERVEKQVDKEKEYIPATNFDKIISQIQSEKNKNEKTQFQTDEENTSKQKEFFNLRHGSYIENNESVETDNIEQKTVEKSTKPSSREEKVVGVASVKRKKPQQGTSKSVKKKSTKTSAKSKGVSKMKAEKTKKTRMKAWVKVVIALLIILALLFGGLIFVYQYFMSNLNHQELDPDADLGIDTSLFEDKTPQQQEIVNIALFGIDQMDSMEGRSDAIMVLSIDTIHNKIKLVSLARDTYVTVPGRSSKTKLTHAFVWGGAELAIQTINTEFNMNISEYVAVNFSKLIDIIDFLGGVTVDNLTQAQVDAANGHMGSMGFKKSEYLDETGDNVLLTGKQALALSRTRYIAGGDDMRTSRQREILDCIFEKALSMSVTEYPELIKQMMGMCETSLSSKEILALTPILLKKPPLIQDAFPNDYIDHEGDTIKGTWYYVYDTSEAADMLHQFIYDDIMFAEQGKSKE